MQAFNKIQYKKAFAFFQHERDNASAIDIPQNCQDTDIDEIIKDYWPDIYIVDNKFRWAYIKTHEES